MKNKFLTPFTSLLLLCYSCKQTISTPDSVSICGKVWAAKNLDVAYYTNGDPIPRVDNAAAWDTLTTGAYCYYGKDSATNALYGKLYNWYAIADPRGLAPINWHVATFSEWYDMIKCLGGYSSAGGKLKSTDHWQQPNSQATNSSNFTALPGGRIFVRAFRNIGLEGYWWSATTIGETEAYYVTLNSNSGMAYPSIGLRSSGFSIRCVKD